MSPTKPVLKASERPCQVKSQQRPHFLVLLFVVSPYFMGGTKSSEKPFRGREYFFGSVSALGWLNPFHWACTEAEQEGGKRVCRLLTSRWLKKAVGREPVDGDILAGHARSELRRPAKPHVPGSYQHVSLRVTVESNLSSSRLIITVAGQKQPRNVTVTYHLHSSLRIVS